MNRPFKRTLGAGKEFPRSHITTDKMTPVALLGYQSTIQASTKYSPFFMVYIRQATLPIGLESASINVEESSIEMAANSSHDKAHFVQMTTATALENSSQA